MFFYSLIRLGPRAPVGRARGLVCDGHGAGDVGFDRAGAGTEAGGEATGAGVGAAGGGGDGTGGGGEAGGETAGGGDAGGGVLTGGGSATGVAAGGGDRAQLQFEITPFLLYFSTSSLSLSLISQIPKHPTFFNLRRAFHLLSLRENLI